MRRNTGRFNLLPALLDVYKLWRKNNKRYSFFYCPVCHHDLNGDNDSFQFSNKRGWHYTCADCGCKSIWILDAPAPILRAYQRFQKKITEINHESEV